MKRLYNKSKRQRARKTRYNPNFWEIPIEYQALCRFSDDQRLWYTPEEEPESLTRRRERMAEVMALVRRVIEESLTKRQKEILQLYFFEKKTENEIAEQLGIAVPSVSQHLFGKKRAGQTVGGAIPKLRKETRKRGIGYRVSE